MDILVPSCISVFLTSKISLLELSLKLTLAPAVRALICRTWSLGPPMSCFK
jgi:hypothetical protein